MVTLVQVTDAQVAALEGAGRQRFAAALRHALASFPDTAAQAAARPPEWFDWAVTRAGQHGIDDQVDVCEFTAQLLVRGEALLDDPAARAGLDHPTNPAWLRVRHFAGNRLIVDREG